MQDPLTKNKIQPGIEMEELHSRLNTTFGKVEEGQWSLTNEVVFQSPAIPRDSESEEEDNVDPLETEAEFRPRKGFRQALDEEEEFDDLDFVAVGESVSTGKADIVNFIAHEPHCVTDRYELEEPLIIGGGIGQIGPSSTQNIPSTRVGKDEERRWQGGQGPGNVAFQQPAKQDSHKTPHPDRIKLSFSAEDR